MEYDQTKAAQTQREIFLGGEGDKWFERNASDLMSRQTVYEADRMAEVLFPFKDNIHNILEIGCGNGAKLLSLCKSLNAHGMGIDPSAKAVDSANSRAKSDNLSDVHFKVGSSAILDFGTATFDFVYFGFCLYLVDRSELFQTISEADRVLKPGGFLSILDFDPSIRHKRAYCHRENVFSYKNDYPSLFTASGHYHLVEKHSFSHSTNHFVRDPGERVAISILYKETDAY